MKLKEESMNNGLVEVTKKEELEQHECLIKDSVLNDQCNLKNYIKTENLTDKFSNLLNCEEISEGVSLLTDNDVVNETTLGNGKILCQTEICLENSTESEESPNFMNETDDAELSCGNHTKSNANLTLNSVLQTIPSIAYDPKTKQLHMLTQDDDKDSANIDRCENPINNKICGSITKTNEVNEESVDIKQSSHTACDSFEQTVGTSSLSRADGSSFSSISSLSTNTDISASALSGNDLESCCANNDFEICRKPQSEGQNQDDSFQNSGVKSKRRGISKFLSRNIFSWKSKENDIEPLSNNQIETNTYVVPPSTFKWKTFSKSIPATNSASESDEVCSQSCSVKNSSSYSSPIDCVPNSTSALILEDRPHNLPKKSAEEAQKHKIQYENMIEAARKKELKEAKHRKKLQQLQLKQEEVLSNSSRMWNKEILPNWENMKQSKKVKELWWQGLPPNVRGKIWKLAMGNDLNITEELYEICVNRALDRIRQAIESASICSEDVDTADSTHDKESSVEFIKLDVSRTFPHLCIFQKGGPYYDSLHSLLGAYVCYRPDVGYVQGMSFLAAVLILNLDVADAFVCFANLLNKPCQMAFFRLDEPVMKAYFLTYEELFKENFVKLFHHFARQNVTPDLYLMEWIYTLFSKSLPLDIASRVWDVFFRDGEEFLFRVALGILNMYKESLLEMEFIHLAQFLTKLPDDLLVEPLFKSIESIKMIADKKRFNQILASHMSNFKV